MTKIKNIHSFSHLHRTLPIHTACFSCSGWQSLFDSETAIWLQQRAREVQKGAMKTFTANIHKDRRHGRKVLLSCMQGTRTLQQEWEDTAEKAAAENHVCMDKPA